MQQDGQRETVEKSNKGKIEEEGRFRRTDRLAEK